VVPDTYVITGDIDAMWLRDSSAQVAHYIPFMAQYVAVNSVRAPFPHSILMFQIDESYKVDQRSDSSPVSICQRRRLRQRLQSRPKRQRPHRRFCFVFPLAFRRIIGITLH